MKVTIVLMAVLVVSAVRWADRVSVGQPPGEGGGVGGGEGGEREGKKEGGREGRKRE